MRGLTSEDIRNRYIDDLRRTIAAERAADQADYEAAGLEAPVNGDGSRGRSFLGDIMGAGAFSWPCSNLCRFAYPPGFALTKSELGMFEASDVVWSYASVCVEDGQLYVEVLLVDTYEDEV